MVKLFIAMILVLVACSPSLDPDLTKSLEGPSPAGMGIRDGITATASQYTNVVALEYDSANGPEIFCSGTLISPFSVLTAGHCAQQIEEHWDSPMRVVYPDGTRAAITATSIHPQYVFDVEETPYHEGALSADIAVIRVERSSVAPASLYEGPFLELGTVLTAVGYGYDGGSDGWGSYGIRRYGTLSLDGYFDIIDDNPQDNQIITPISSGIMYFFHDSDYENSICLGDSGGPVLTSTGAVAGVATGGISEFNTCRSVYFGLHVAVSPFASTFIRPKSLTYDNPSGCAYERTRARTYQGQWKPIFTSGTASCFDNLRGISFSLPTSNTLKSYNRASLDCTLVNRFTGRKTQSLPTSSELLTARLPRGTGSHLKAIPAQYYWVQAERYVSQADPMRWAVDPNTGSRRQFNRDTLLPSLCVRRYAWASEFPIASGIPVADGGFEPTVVAEANLYGDFNRDGAIDGEDIAPMITALTASQLTIAEIQTADADGNGEVDGEDIQPFIDVLMNGFRRQIRFYIEEDSAEDMVRLLISPLENMASVTRIEIRRSNNDNMPSALCNDDSPVIATYDAPIMSDLMAIEFKAAERTIDAYRACVYEGNSLSGSYGIAAR